VKPGGVFVSAVAAPSQTEAVRRDVRASFMLVHVETRYLDELRVRFEDGRIRPNVGRVLPLGEARLAHEMLEGSRPSGPGKIVLAVR
jgi:NADPH:quinone reductase-like Zn-dependent oxidoreductase